jgi:hypothetical protein
MEGPGLESLDRQDNTLVLGPKKTRVQWVPGHITEGKAAEACS